MDQARAQGKKNLPKSQYNWKRIEQIEADYDKKIDICKRQFLSDLTAEGLRMTLHSTIQLGKLLLKDYNFEYVLTRKMCQDCLEV